MRKTIAGTGHRPDKIGGYDEATYARLLSVATYGVAVYSPARIISGGALGWDQALARAAIRAGIPLTMALPFRDFDKVWSDEARRSLRKLLDAADEIVYVCGDDGWAAWKYHERNEWMVDNADLILALWDGRPASGTYDCVQRARGAGVEVVNLWGLLDGKD